jgi:hypothetical protein
MLRAVFWLILALLWSVCATLFFAQGEVITGVLDSLLAITCAALSLITAREER